MADRPDCAAIVTSVAMLASNLGMVTVAEGVETERQHELVQAAGCTEGQGYYFDRPRPAAEILGSGSRPRVPICGPSSLAWSSPCRLRLGQGHGSALRDWGSA